MAWSESQVICRQHPKEIPQPGICPTCLRERLSEIAGDSRFSTGNYIYYYNSSDSPSISGSPVYYYGCSSSGGCSSPAAARRRERRRIASDVMDSIYMAMGGNVIGNGLKKSRSMAAFASKSIVGGRENGGVVNRKKKLGFWSKLLLRSTCKKSDF